MSFKRKFFNVLALFCRGRGIKCEEERTGAAVCSAEWMRLMKERGWLVWEDLSKWEVQ